MSLPSSGQISLNDFRAEMSQSTTSNYGFDGAFYGFQYPDFYPSIPWYSPINVHSDNADNFETNQYYWNIDAWYGYNNSAYYALSSTSQSCYFNIQPNQNTASYATAMIMFYVGTGSGVIPIRISGSANDFLSSSITTASIWYGKPWSSSGTGSGFSSQADQLLTAYNLFMRTTILPMQEFLIRELRGPIQLLYPNQEINLEINQNSIV